MEGRHAARSASVPDVEGGGGEELGRRAPAWVPDTASPGCQECRRTFSFLVRRHHCRACGRLLCNTCCGHTYPLQYLRWAPARVCLTCKERLDGPRWPPRRSRSLNSMADETIARLVREMQVESSKRRSLSLPHHHHHRGEDPAASLIGLLPPEVLSKIFDLLGHSDKLACRAVCHHWLQAIETSSFHKENLIHVGSAQLEHLSDILSCYCRGRQQFQNFRFFGLSLVPSLPLWSVLGPSLRVLELCGCEVGEKDLVSILGQARRLQTLALVNCRETFMSGNFLSNPADLGVVKGSLAGLRSLCLDGNKYLSDVLLMRISETTPMLEHLSVSDCNMMNDAGIYLKHYPASQQIVASPSVLTWRIVCRVVQNLAATITSLDVSRNAGVDLEMLSRVMGLSLTRINLSCCSAVSQEGFHLLALANPALAVVGLASCRRVFAGLRETTLDICRSLGHLTSLDLSHLSVPHFSVVGALRHLAQLVLDNLDAPGGEIMAGLRQLDLGRLARLQARYLSVSSPDLLELLSSRKFPQLRRLDLSHGCESVITDQILMAICWNMRGLTHLNLASNPLLSDAGTVGTEENAATSDLKSTEETESGQQEGVTATLKASPEERRGGLVLLDRLVSLDLSSTAVSERTLCAGIASPDLRHLSLNHCSRVEDGGLYQLAVRHPRLERLELRSCLLSDTGLVSSLSCLPRLVYLDLGSCGYVTSSGVKAVEQVAPQLQTLVLSNCPNVSVEAARALEMAMPALKSLETHGLQRERMGGYSSYMKPIPPPPPPPPHTEQLLRPGQAQLIQNSVLHHSA